MITSDLKKLPFYTPAKSNKNTAKLWKRESLIPTDEGKFYAKSLIAFMKKNSSVIGANLLKGIVRDIVDSDDLHSEKSRAFFSELESAIVMTEQEPVSGAAKALQMPKVREKRRYGFTMPEVADEINISPGRLIAYMVNNEWIDSESLQPTEDAIRHGMLRSRRELPFVITNKGLALLRSKKIMFS